MPTTHAPAARRHYRPHRGTRRARTSTATSLSEGGAAPAGALSRAPASVLVWKHKAAYPDASKRGSRERRSASRLVVDDL